jgi:formate hydrogenlyase subunit 6/NADH:ubiquinone oxidoreductase subunit I
MTEKYHGVQRSKIPWHPTINYDECINCGTCINYCKLGARAPMPSRCYKFSFKTSNTTNYKKIKRKIITTTNDDCANFDKGNSIAALRLLNLRNCLLNVQLAYISKLEIAESRIKQIDESKKG